jgi:hypothetical protein
LSSSSNDGKLQKENVDNLRTSDALTVGVLVADLLRLHIGRIDTGCVADLFALSEVALPADLAGDIRNWVTRSSNDILDIPEGEARAAFLAEVGALPAAKVPKRLRDAVAALAGTANAATLATLESLAQGWADVEPEVVVLSKRATKTVTGAAPAAAVGAKPAVARAPKVRTGPAKTPAADVDPRRAAFVREDAIATLKLYERGVKEGILVAGIRSRCPFKDLTDSEVRAELRKLERERKLKHSAERWLMR